MQLCLHSAVEQNKNLQEKIKQGYLVLLFTCFSSISTALTRYQSPFTKENT